MEELLAAWPIAAPRQIRPQTGGINNLTQYVQTPAGDYILRIYGSQRDLAKVRYELAIMEALRRQDLSFAVPAPLPSCAGDPIVITPEGAPSTLVPVIPGVMPDRDNLLVEQAYPIGQALGELTRALELAGPDVPSLPRRTYGDMAPIPGIDPRSVPAQAPVPPEQQARLLRMVCEVQEVVADHYARLPRQIIHGDFVPGNLLMQDGRVSGVLDFEIALNDLRALDLAMALAAWGSKRWHTGTEWAMLEAFARGYFSRLRLLPEEVKAIPFLMRLRHCVTFLHMTGRYLRGEAPLEIALHGADLALRREEWLERNGSELAARVREWSN